MEETFANPDFGNDSPMRETHASQKAAGDLRAAASDKAKQITQDAGAKAQQLKQTAVDKAQQFREFAGSKANEIKETAGVKAQQFKEAAGEQLQHSRVKAREVHADAEEYVRQHPTKSVLTALGAGIVIGLILRR